MRLLLDQGLPRSTVVHLSALGIIAVHVGELGMSAATDSEIIETARQRDAVVVTLDADFHSLLAQSRATSPSVIRIRIERLKGPALATLLSKVIAIVTAELEQGAVVSVTSNRVRVRSLPLGA